MDRISLLHLSYDPVPQFSPRVPQIRAPGEDGKTKRICLSPTIEDAINSKPGHAAMVFAAMYYRLPIALFIYRAEIPVEDVLFPEELAKEYGVKDAPLNHEHWVLSTPNFSQEIWVLDNVIPETGFLKSVPRVEMIETHKVDEMPPYCLQSALYQMRTKFGLDIRTGAFLNTLEELDEKCKEQKLPLLSKYLYEILNKRKPKLIQ